MRKTYFFKSSFLNFFRILSENFFRLLAKKLQEFVKTTFYVSRGTICGLNFYIKFWIVSDFLQKPLAQFSKIYLSVQGKNCGRNIFFVFLFRFFSNFEQNIFRLLAKKLQKFVKTNFSVSTGTTCGFKLFLKVLNRFGFSAETFGMVLKMLSTCPDENLRKKYIFLFFLSEFFSDLGENFFRLLAKKLQEFVKTTFYKSRGTICGLIFFKFSNVSDFLQKYLAWFSKFYLRVQSKNCGKNSFFCFSFQNFFEFSAKYFQTFGQKTSKICEN